MRSFRTSVVLAAAVAALSWSSVSNAEDTTKSSKGTTSQTKSESKKTTHSSSSTSDTSAPSSGTTGTGTSGTGTSGTGTTSGTMSGDTSGTGTTMSGTTDTTTGTTSTTTTTTPPPSTGTMPGSTTTPPPGSIYDQYGAPAPSTTTSTTTTTAAEYQEGVGAEKAGYEFRPNRPLLATGALMLVAPYTAGAIVAASNDRDYDDNLWWPVAGPWIDLAERPTGLFDGGSAEDWNQVLLIGSGVAQGVGVALMITSLIVPEKRSSPAMTSARERSLAASKPRVTVTPITVRGGSGLGAAGTF